MSGRVLLALLRRPRGTILVAIGIAIAGLAALREIPVATVPSVELPVMMVTAALPGASPQTMAEIVATPLQETLGTISGVGEMTATNVEGVSRIVLQFEDGRDPTRAARDVQAAINAARVRLPPGMPAPPFYQKLNPSDAPALFLAVTSETLPPERLYDLARRIIVPELTRQPGVAAALIQGAERSAVRVRADARTMSAMGMTLEGLGQAVLAGTWDGPLGTVEQGGGARPLLIPQPADPAEAIAETPIGTPGPGTVRLADLAQVEAAPANTRSGAWYNGRSTIFVFVQRSVNANLLETARNVRAAIPAMQRMLPASVSIAVIADRSDSILPMVSEAALTVGLTMLAIGIVVLAALRDRWLALIAIVNVPLSLLGTILVMKLLGYSLNLVSLAGITVSIGLVIDDGIVVVENIQRRRAVGDAGALTVLRATHEVAFTVVAISLALIATLSPLIVIHGAIGAMVVQFAATVAIAVAFSGLFSLTLTPVLAALGPVRGRRAPAARAGMLHGSYVAALAWTCRRPWRTLALSLAVLAASLPLWTATPKGLLPLQDTGVILGIVTARADIPFAQMSERLADLSRVIGADRGVRSVSIYLGSNDASVTSSARVYVALRPKEPIRAAIDRLRPRAAQVAGLATSLQPLEDLRISSREGVGANQLVLRSERADELARWLPLVVDRLRRLPSIRDVGTDQAPDGSRIQVTVDRDALAIAGASAGAADAAFLASFGQQQLRLINRPFDQIPLILERADGAAGEPDALRSIYLRRAEAGAVALPAVAQWRQERAPIMVTQDRLLPSATITFSVAEGRSIAEAMQEIEDATRQIRLPSRIRLGFGGEASAFIGLIAQPLTFALALFAVYLVLGILYESLLAPLSIIAVLPVAGVGGLLALRVAGLEITVVAVMGLVLVGGIMLKNAIILVNFAACAQRDAGLSAARAMVEAGRHRFRPVQMTTLAALLGAIPIAFASGLGAEFRQPLGVAVIGGLIVGQVVTLLTTPAIYVLLDRLRRVAPMPPGVRAA